METRTKIHGDLRWMILETSKQRPRKDRIMRITNKQNLPEPLVRAITNDNYDKGGADYSVTDLIKPPRITALEKRHWEELVEDASDRLWLLMGKAGHEVLRRSSEGGIVEERCIIDFEGYKVSGQLDYAVTEQSIIDYKFTSIWAVKDGVKPEWDQQLNCYKYLAEQYGVEVKELKIIAILRDWNINEAKRNPELPQAQVVVLPVRVWAKEAVEHWMRHRIALHENARNGVLPDCTTEEMWERPARYAVMKKGNKKASRVLDSKLEAGQWMASQPSPSQFEIEVRPAERPRCENYCSVSEFCEVYKQWKGQNP